jgi:hypothetical protein
VTLAELDDLLGDEGQVAHVAKANLLGVLDLVAASLAFNNGIRDLTGLKNINGQGSVVSTLHRAVEDLLDHVIYNIMKEVIPGEPEEEALETVSRKLPSEEKKLREHTKMVGTTLFSTNMIFK